MIVDEVLEWCKCGTGTLSALPTVLWAAGAAALARRLLVVLFRRSMFRRAPYWELALQHLLFVWMVIYSVHFWVVLVRLVKLLIDVAYNEDNDVPLAAARDGPARVLPAAAGAAARARARAAAGRPAPRLLGAAACPAPQYSQTLQVYLNILLYKQLCLIISATLNIP
ncbi:uncharacterized protein LOC133523944 isoform X2 [Cydia pomonella]|uniref:uncharacterized protein LOC133523944 isoform X2 n=1 Tax=Cydia pomonella TaxID=82600 RepID=UPI002ADE37C8|nr:uncharacterized protein LOC133523944 isoform X2 [Cydia pomonella]